MSLIGDHLGPFQVLHPIAEGGMAEVYAVEDPQSGDRYAVKLLVIVEKARERFDREFAAMSRLNHPNIVRVYHYGMHGEQPWMSMELLQGIPAQAWVKRMGKPGEAARTRAAIQLSTHLARALNYIHDRGLVHRDLKSANVMVLPDGRLKLIDFGTAHLMDIDPITRVGEFIGTFAYASPEQVSGAPIDGRSDIYSAGVLLYRMLTGRRPFSSTDSAQLIHAHLHTRPPDPRTWIPDLDPRLCDLLLKMLAKSPSKRPQTGREVAEALEHIGGDVSVIVPLTLHNVRAADRLQTRKQIDAHLQSAPGNAALVLGDPGSGRQRLLDDVLHSAKQRGWVVFRADLTDGTDVATVLKMLDRIGQYGADTTRTVNALQKITSADATRLAVDEVRQALHQSLLSTLAQIAKDTPVLLGIIGLEHASQLTLDVLANARGVAHQRGIAVGLVASSSAAALANMPELKHRFPDALQAHLPPLSPVEVARSVGRMLGRRPPPSSISRDLHDITGGQPLYLEAVVRRLVREGTLQADSGNRVVWGGSRIHLEVPKLALDHAIDILGRQPTVHRRLLEALALLDEPVPVEVLWKGLGWEPEETEVVVQHLVDDLVLRQHGDGLSWRYRQVREQVLRDLHPSRRRVLERGLAMVIGNHAPSPGQVRLLLSIGETDAAASRAIQATRALLQRHAYRKAMALIEPVVEQSFDLDPAADAEVNLLLTRCSEVLRPRDSSAAKALAVARRLRPDGLAAEVELAAAGLAQAIGHTVNHRKFLDAAWEAVHDSRDRLLQATIAIEQASVARQTGRLDDMARWIDQIRTSAIASGKVGAMVSATIAASELSLTKGDVRQAEAQANKAMQFAVKARDFHSAWRVAPVLSEPLRHQGRYSEALAHLRRHLPHARRGDDPIVYIRLLAAAARCELDMCRLGQAQELLDSIIAELRPGERLDLRLETSLLEGRIYVASGQLVQARRCLGEVFQKARKAHLSLIAEQTRTLLAQLAALEGSEREAIDGFKAATLSLMGMGDRLALAEVCVAHAQLPTVDPVPTLSPVRELLESQPLPALQLQTLLARGEHLVRQRDERAARICFRDATKALSQITSGLNDADRAVMRVHPWARRIKRGLR